MLAHRRDATLANVVYTRYVHIQHDTCTYTHTLTPLHHSFAFHAVWVQENGESQDKGSDGDGTGQPLTAVVMVSVSGVGFECVLCVWCVVRVCFV